MTTLEIARGYVAAGISVIPIKADGTKAPAGALLPEEVDEATGEVHPSWNEYKRRLPTDEELTLWFDNTRLGIGIVCGAVSGGLEVLDFDRMEMFEFWRKELEKRRPGFLALFPQVSTPGGGMHVYYRTAGLGGNQKLAKLAPEDEKHAAETRAEGGYVVAPGSPPGCHRSKGVYRHVAGPPITELPTI